MNNTKRCLTNKNNTKGCLRSKVDLVRSDDGDAIVSRRTNGAAHPPAAASAKDFGPTEAPRFGRNAIALIALVDSQLVSRRPTQKLNQPTKLSRHDAVMRLVIFLLFATVLDVAAIRWLGLNLADQPWTEAKHCPKNKVQRKKYGLVGSQSKLCKRHTEMMPVIMRAAQLTAYTCQTQFADRRWNCSSVSFAPRMKPDLTKGTREQAYLYALSSAAITHQVAKACVSGDLPFCPCGANPTSPTDGTFKWKGCSDNVVYGQKVSREWADAPWRKKRRRAQQRNRTRTDDDDEADGTLYNDMAIMSMEEFMRNSEEITPRAKMNQHNNDVGREVTHQQLTRKCKCHGVSSSCSVRTCWNTLPELHVIAEKLKDRYVQATEVRAMSKTRPQLEFEPVALTGSVSKENLVYIRKSPDYCTEDRRVGSIGTKGRLCNATSDQHDGCDTMCCGRGYTTESMEVEEQCHCKYVHCCYVKCKQCRFTVSRHYCK
uniref:Protein Wnt n=1 Tax=Plectus sambesii TaxID=2011161 RepID=A0A914WIB1_9BILA